MPLQLRRTTVLLTAALLALAGASAAQLALRRATTVPALTEYLAFFHGQPVRVRGELLAGDDLVWLLAGDERVLLRGPDVAAAAHRDGAVEATGIFWDPGRLQPGDPRMALLDVPGVSQILLDREWPGIGELPLLAVDAIVTADRPPAPGVTALSVEPERYLDQHVTLVGRFRGRNLYGDLPSAPGQSRWDFVLQVADGAVWVTGMEPRGRDFRLNPQARVDTGNWLEVSGIVRHRRGLVWLEADHVALADPDGAEPVEAVHVEVPPPPLPEVIFSAPTAGEINVAPDTSVRLQFSRDMDDGTFRDRVRVAYVDEQPLDREEAQPRPIGFQTVYRGANRVLEIRFDEPLERFRTLRVDLLEGIRALDGSALVPWSLTVQLGG